MIFHPINLLYFAIVTPIVLLISFFLMRMDKEKNKIIYLSILVIALFIVRILLVVFANTIGIMPYLEYDIIFYTLLTIFGVTFTILYLFKVEGLNFQEIGWKTKDLKKSILYGLLAYLPLLAFMPLILILTGLEVSFTVSWEKIILGIEFGFILGGFFEETMFRGIIQNYLSNGKNERFTIIATALIFTATHLGYLPFIGFGIYYYFVLLMAIILSYLRLKLDLVASAILHGGIVFFLILAV